MNRSGRIAAIEIHTIYAVPQDERHGKAADLFTVWFGANIMMLTIATGALAATVFKLSFLASTGAILVGNLVGAVVMALHAAQGPQLGVPQMVQTRGQFGSIGAVAVIGLVVVMYIGFVASNLALVGQSIHSIAGGMQINVWILLVFVISLVATAFGHDLIHAYTRLLSWLAGGALLLCFGWAVLIHGLPAGFLARGGFSVGGFIGAISTGALWQIAYAPYVSDYSRYLPAGIGSRQAFWASYAGCVLGSVFPMILGVLLVIMSGRRDVVPAMVEVLGKLAWLVVPIFAFGMTAANALNLYCGALSTMTIIQTFTPRRRVLARDRVAVTVMLGAAAFLLAVSSSSNFTAIYTDFILLLLYVLVPWTAINLVDYYIVKHGEYDVTAFFRADGGLYGRFNWPAIFCYAVGILIQTPFISNSLYTGPIAHLLGGIDVSWIVGLLSVGPFYWLLMTVRRLSTESVVGP